MITLKKIRNITFLLLLMPTFVFSQVGYVPVEHKIYEFLERMNTLSIIENYNSFETPKTRHTISEYLQQIFKKFGKLDLIDQNQLRDYIVEFEYDLYGTNSLSESLIPNWQVESLFSDNEKYIYSYTDSTKTSLFVNFIGKVDYLNQIIEDKNSSSLLYRFGGELRGTVFDKIGFSVNTTNGSFFGNKDLAKTYSSLKYNFKFNNEGGSNLGDNYFDETSAFIASDFDFLKIKFGNDRKLIGHGAHKVLLSDNAPRMDYAELALNYKSINFSFFHGKLLGNHSIDFEEDQGSIHRITDKYLVYHRLGIDFGRHLQAGIGEMLIYSDRNIDFSYLNPFNFYKSAEHANQDRDNSFLFIDFQNNSISGLKFYSTILIDDIDFGKIGKGWYGNQSLMSFGVYSNILYKTIPLDFEFQYIKIDPYVFTHRITGNNFTNLDYNLGTQLQPNSSSSRIAFYYRLHHRVDLQFGFNYTIHGANEFDEFGNLVNNFGGDILSGHRVNDSKEIYFLSGKNEIFREYLFSTKVEPLKNWILSLSINYNNNTLSRSHHFENFFTSFSVYTKL